MPIALYNVSSDVLRRFGHFSVAHGENSAQGTMLSASRWAKQALGIPCPAAFWDGELSETAPDVHGSWTETLYIILLLTNKEQSEPVKNESLLPPILFNTVINYLIEITGSNRGNCKIADYRIGIRPIKQWITCEV